MTTETISPNPEPYKPASARKRFERAASKVALRLIVGPVRAMPLPLARMAGRGLGAVVYHSFGRYRRVTLKNLNRVYGEQTTQTERVRMARAVFRHFGQVAAEFLKLPRLNRAEIEALVTVEGEENLCRAFEMGRGILVITGHFGNWEAMSRWLALHGYPVNVVARDARSPEATRLLMDTRQSGGAQVFYRGNSVRAVLQALKRNEIVGLLPDQNAADVFVPFFGLPTGTVDGPAVLHLKTRAPLVFAWCARTPDNRFHLTFEQPEVYTPTDDKANDIAQIMALVNARLEAQIRRYPTQWLWLHDRWKASPGVFPEGESGKQAPPKDRSSKEEANQP